MPDLSWRELLVTPISPSFGIGCILVGLYSLLVNRVEALERHYMRDARFAQRAGWFYIVAGAAIVLLKSL